MKQDPTDQTLCPRRAGQVRRYHTWPRLHEQTVAEHTWQVIRILLSIWPEAPRELIVYAIFHDVGEVATGDLPYPTKANDKVLHERISAAECSAQDAMSDRWGHPCPQEIPMEDYGVFKLAEYIEMFEWGLHEMNLGNRYASLVMERMLAEAQRIMVDLPAEVQTAAGRYIETRLLYEKDCQK